MLGYAGRGLQEQNDLRRLGRGLSSSDGNALFSALIIFSKYPGALLVIMEWRRRARRKMRETRRSNCWELLDFPQGKRNPAAGVQLCWLDATNGPSILTQSYVVFCFFFTCIASVCSPSSSLSFENTSDTCSFSAVPLLDHGWIMRHF